MEMAAGARAAVKLGEAGEQELDDEEEKDDE